MTTRRNARRYIVPESAVALAFTCHDVLAYQVVVAFDSSAIQPIPIPQWIVVALLGLLGFCAYRQLKSRPGSQLLRRSLVAATFGISTVVAMAGINWIEDARADDTIAVLTLLQTTPAKFTIPDDAVFEMVMGGGGYIIAVTNKAPGPARIAARSFEPDDNFLQFYPPPQSDGPRPECVVGRVLGPSETCYIAMFATNHWD